MPPKKSPPRDVDRYIASFPPAVQRQLRKVRRAIRSTAPGAHEVISYGIPAYGLNGVGLLSFAAWKRHIALYPAPTGSPRFNKQLQPYRSAKSTVRFPLDEPLPIDLIVQVVKLRIKNSVERARKKAQRRRKQR